MQGMKTCIYCGSSEKLTKDHIPPKCLFPEPTPRNLITVPCCEKCNRKFSKDDEYFRDVILMREDIFDLEDLETLRNKVIRSLRRAESSKYKKKLISGSEKINVFTKNGLFIGEKTTYNVDLNRLRKVIDRITRGLYFKKEGKVLDQNYDVKTYTSEDIANWNLKSQEEWLLLLVNILQKRLHHFGKIFAYNYLLAKDDSNASVWLFNFYQKIVFISITLPKKIIATEDSLETD